MNKRLRRCLALGLVVAIPALLSVGSPALAVISSCTAVVSPHTVPPASQVTIQFVVANNDATDTVRWVKVVRPTADYTVNNASSASWTGYMTFESVTFVLGSIAPGLNDTFDITVQTADTQAPAANWSVQVSDDADGANPVSCSGDTSTAIAGTPLDQTPPTIDNIRVSNVTFDSVTITWTTDELADSKVHYGLTEDYGTTAEDAVFTLNHRVVLTGLPADTGYHFMVESADPSGNATTSNDNTFVTAVAPPPAPPGAAPSPPETKPPSVTVTTALSGVYGETPKISGFVSDNIDVIKIEYSVDGGLNWLPVDKTTGLKSTRATFEFTPANLDDGNFPIVVRAFDGANNVGVSKAVELIIDRLPPVVGAGLLAVGPQLLTPDGNGVYIFLPGIDARLVLSAVGGPTSLAVTATPADPKVGQVQLFSFARSSVTGLWTGILSFKNTGTYILSSDSIDGAGNQRQHQLGTIYVAEPGKVAAASSAAPIKEAEVTVYILEEETRIWTPWDAASYGQQNPQLTDAAGHFSFLLPAGKYYLRVSAPGRRTTLSNIFSLSSPTPLTTLISLKKAWGIAIGRFTLGLPIPATTTIDLRSAALSAPRFRINEENTPVFTLNFVDGSTMASADLLGRPTVLGFFATWHPAAAEQLPALAELQANRDLNIIPVALLETAGRIKAYQATGGYDLRIAADRDGSTLGTFPVRSLPTYVFLSRQGVIKKMLSGVLSKEEIQAALIGL